MRSTGRTLRPFGDIGIYRMRLGPNDRLALRANASQGYIYPTLSQLFLTTTAGGVLLTGNPNLKPETATTLADPSVVEHLVENRQNR